jgi:hypothetical protein
MQISQLEIKAKEDANDRAANESPLSPSRR